MTSIFLCLLTSLISLASGAVYCFGAIFNVSENCNSDVEGLPPIASPYVMGFEQVTYAVNTTFQGIQYPAATITFSTIGRTVVRVWDSWVCGDTFQLTLNGDSLPIMMAADFPFLALCPVIVDTAEAPSTFRSRAFAWTEIILDNPAEWTLSISVARAAFDEDVPMVGSVVQQFIETLSFEANQRCPFD